MATFEMSTIITLIDLLLLANREIDIRYSALAELARTRSIVSLGLSFFRKEMTCNDIEGDVENISATYRVDTFEILCHCHDNYILDDDARRFLTNHGFDFDVQESIGIPYRRGNDANVSIEIVPGKKL